jgi:S-layer homology domain
MSNFSTKIASTVSVVALVATAMSASLVSAASEFLPYATLLADNSVIGTQTNESGYRLGDTVTRAELAKVTANLGGFTIASCAGTTYGDVGTSLGDLCGAIEALAEAGVISTANANFRPSAAITRAEATKMLLGAVGEEGSSTDAGYMDTASLGDLAMYINRANEMACAADATYFRPAATASRGEAFKLAACVAGLTPTTPPTEGSGVVVAPTGTGVVAGAVTVALDGVATAQYVPKNASSVKVGAIKLTAGAADVIVNSVTVTRSGLGPVADIYTVSLAQNGSVVSDNRSLNSTSQTAIVRFTTPMTIKAGMTASYDVLVSLASGAQPNSQHQFAVTAVSAGAATITGLPVTLGLINTTSYSATTVNVASITTAGSVTSGKTAQRIVNVKIDGGSNRDTTVTAFTLSKNTGEDFTKAFANMSAYRNGVKVGNVVVTTDKIYVTGLNTMLLAGESADYELRADTIYVGVSATTTFKINDTTDVSATETTTGYAAAVTAANTAYPITLAGVQISWTKTSTGSRTVAPGTSSVALFDAKVSSDATFDVTNYTLTATSPGVFNSGTAAASFSRLVLNVDGIETDLLTVANPASVSLSSSSDKFRVEAGKLVSVKVTGTLKSNAVAAAYRFTVALTQAKNVSNGNTVTLTSSQAGDTVTVSNGKATFKAATNNVGVLASKKLTANASNTEIGRFAILAEAEDVTVRKLVLTNSTSAGVVPAVSPAIVDLTNLISGNGVKLVDLETGADISATVTVAAGTITVDSMSLLVLKDTTKNIKVVANTTALTSIPSGETNFTLHINAPIAGDVTRQSTGNADLVGAVIAASNTTGEFVAASSTYVAGKALPVVSLTKIGTDLTRYMVTITNVDPESALLVDRLTLKATPGLLNGTTAVTWDGMVCVRNGATGDCGVSGTSTAAANIASAAGSEFTLAGTIPNLSLVKNNGTVSFEIYAPNLPFFSAGGLTLSLKNLKYDGSVTGEDYTGMVGASVTANK